MFLLKKVKKKIKKFTYVSGYDCGSPTYNYCVENNGIIRLEGSVWYVTLCEQCTCKDGDIICTKVPPPYVCPPSPGPHCKTIPTDCCPNYDCEVIS